MVDQLLDNPITPVQGAAKDFIGSMFENEELAIKEVKIADYDLVFKNEDEDPITKLAIKLLSTIAKKEGSEAEIAIDGLVKFLSGIDVNEKLTLEVTLKDNTVLKIEGVNFSFTRDRALTDEEIKALQRLN